MPRRRPKSSTDRLVDMAEEAFRTTPWHGPNLRAALHGVTWQEAAWSPGPGRPSIWALTLHCAYWKLRVCARLTGENLRLHRPGRDWPALPDALDASTWNEDRRALLEIHKHLVDAIRDVDPAELDVPGPGQKRTRLRIIQGIAFHDVYHAGQIRVLRKLYPGA